MKLCLLPQNVLWCRFRMSAPLKRETSLLLSLSRSSQGNDLIHSELCCVFGTRRCTETAAFTHFTSVLIFLGWSTALINSLSLVHRRTRKRWRRGGWGVSPVGTTTSAHWHELGLSWQPSDRWASCSATEPLSPNFITFYILSNGALLGLHNMRRNCD